MKPLTELQKATLFAIGKEGIPKKDLEFVHNEIIYSYSSGRLTHTLRALDYRGRFLIYYRFTGEHVSVHLRNKGLEILIQLEAENEKGNG